MEKITLRKLYETLAQKVGRNEAEYLTQYIEMKVKGELNTIAKDTPIAKRWKWIKILFIITVILLLGLYPLFWFKR